MLFPNIHDKKRRIELGREWGKRSGVARQKIRDENGVDAETLRMRALHDAKGMLLREGCTYSANGEKHWSVCRSVGGRTNQRDILIDGQIFKTCGPRRLPAWLR